MNSERVEILSDRSLHDHSQVNLNQVEKVNSEEQIILSDNQNRT